MSRRYIVESIEGAQSRKYKVRSIKSGYISDFSALYTLNSILVTLGDVDV